MPEQAHVHITLSKLFERFNEVCQHRRVAMETLEGNQHYVFDIMQATWCLKDTPHAFGMRVCRTLRDGGY